MNYFVIPGIKDSSEIVIKEDSCTMLEIVKTEIETQIKQNLSKDKIKEFIKSKYKNISTELFEITYTEIIS